MPLQEAPRNGLAMPLLFVQRRHISSLGVRHRVGAPSPYRCPLPTVAEEGQGAGGLACPCGGDPLTKLQLTAAARPDRME